MGNDILNEMLAAFSVKSNKIVFNKKRFNNAIKLDNDDDNVRDLTYSSKNLHYNLCK